MVDDVVVVVVDDECAPTMPVASSPRDKG